MNKKELSMINPSLLFELIIPLICMLIMHKQYVRTHNAWRLWAVEYEQYFFQLQVE